MSNNITEEQVIEYLKRINEDFKIQYLHEPAILHYPRITFNQCRFFREDMTVLDFLRERLYMKDHMEDMFNGTYKTLWQQEHENE